MHCSSDWANGLLSHRSVWGWGHAALKSICATEPSNTLIHQVNTTNVRSIDPLVFAESLSRLQDVVEYLKRLPPVPATLEQVRDIEKYLNDPETRVAHSMALACEEEARLRLLSRKAETFTPAGVPVLQLEVCGEKVSVRISNGYLENPSEAPQRQKLIALAVRQLQDGLELNLKHMER